MRYLTFQLNRISRLSQTLEDESCGGKIFDRISLWRIENFFFLRGVGNSRALKFICWDLIETL